MIKYLGLFTGVEAGYGTILVSLQIYLKFKQILGNCRNPTVSNYQIPKQARLYCQNGTINIG
jgi:hypothetical protein